VKIIISYLSLKLLVLKQDTTFKLSMLINTYIFNLFICITKCWIDYSLFQRQFFSQVWYVTNCIWMKTDFLKATKKEF